MERRVLLAISLSFLVLFAYQALVPVPPPVDPGSSPPLNGSPTTATEPPVSSAPPSRTVSSPEATVADVKDREFVIDTTTVRAVFTNRGARLKRWELKGYRDQSGALVDLVPSNTQDQPLPFSLSEAALDQANVNQALFAVLSDPPERIDATASPAALTFAFETTDGLVVRKRFTMQPAGYELAVTIEATRQGAAVSPRILWGPGLGDEIAGTAGSGGFFSGNYVYPAAGFVHVDGNVTRFSGAAAATAGPQRGSFRYAGVTDHYFVASVVDPPSAFGIDFAYVPLPSPQATGTMRQFVAFAIAFDQPQRELRFFVGPKQFDALSAVNPEFTKVIDYGMFAVLAVPLRGALEWVNRFVGNYGWSIIVLTILINLVMAPLRHKSVVSMRKMQEIQPQLKVIQDRYANLKMTDPARGKMNEEVMALYKAKGANPASGCLPMLLTLPVLFAFYSLLSQAIEIRGASFAGWIPDLSQRDPLYITPLLMGVTMFWQQRQQPGTGDPVQQKVLMFMPVMFTGMMLAAPSGLVIYWLVSQLWAIGQQYFTNWMIGPPKTVGAKR